MKNILVIDDIKDNLLLMKSVLETYIQDCKVVTEESGHNGIKRAREIQPELILLDIYMPEISGFEVCKELKNDESTRYIPILMVSAYGNDPKIRVESLNTGADAFISKPFDQAELVALINVLFRTKAAEDSLRKQNADLEYTIQRQLEENLEQEARVQQMNEYSHEFFWEMESTGKLSYVSRVVKHILGYSNKELVGKKHIHELAANSSRELLKKRIEVAFQTKKSLMLDSIHMIHKKGNNVWVKLNAFPYFGPDDEFKGLRGVCYNVTERIQADILRQNSFQKIKDYQKRLKELNTELIVAEERERKRIAEYIHDGFGQQLSIAHMRLSLLSTMKLNPKVQKIVQESSHLINEAIKESRSLTYDLSPTILFELGLIAAIKWKLNQIQKEFGLNAQFKGSELKLKIQNNLNIIIYRVVCELIANITKHAKAKLVEVKLSQYEESLFISVADDGKGFEYDPNSNLTEYGGYGLFSINEKLDSLNGSINIQSEIGKGTTVKLLIPLESNENQSTNS